jgi:two-component system, OmpR family, phosphate regulon sensor histidine kinase PhoR
MNIKSVKVYIFAIVFLSSLLSGLVALSFFPDLAPTLFVCIVISLLNACIIYILIHTLFFKRITDILLTVKKNRKISADEPLAIVTSYGNDDITELEYEILAWADDRKNEIDRLKKLELYRKEFLGNVSHELKTPIFNIQGYVLTLLDGGLDDPTINKKYLERASQSVDRMIHIIEDLEAISQLETGELIIYPEKFDIVALAKSVVDAEEIRALPKGIILNMPKDINPIIVEADKFRIRQVLTNLIVNSIKYGREYGETKIRFYETGDTVSVEVADNGIGIASEHLPRLFERFYRVDKGRSREQGGTGLGLSIVKHIIEAHHQVIQVTSKVDVGTTFTFTLKKSV